MRPSAEKWLLQGAEWVVPAAERAAWRRGWEAELWQLRAARPGQSLWVGLLRDAAWLRGESWRCALEGTALLSLAGLGAMVLGLFLVGLALRGEWTPGVEFTAEFRRSMFAAPLVLFVGVAIASQREGVQRSYSLAGSAFFAGKTALAMLIAFLLSTDFCFPVQTMVPVIADLSQMLCFVLAALVGIRWSFDDQQRRCKQCLRALAGPARVGRPSHNLLEWNGTELRCSRGHGALNVPELETSWCRASVWVDGLRVVG